MDPRAVATGFLGTGASFAADVALIAYIFLIVPGMLVGFVFARRQMFAPHHKVTMTSITLLNWAIILYLMAVSYSRTVSPNVPQALNQPFFLSPSIHLIFGLTAQVIGTIMVLRMWLENGLTPRLAVGISTIAAIYLLLVLPVLPAGVIAIILLAGLFGLANTSQRPLKLRFEPIKPWMRLTLGLWLVTATFGVVTYVIWYGIPFTGGNGNTGGGGEGTPAATQSVVAPVAAGPVTVTVPLKGFLFVPVDITIPVGAKLKFVNQDSAPHTVTYADDSVNTGNFFKGDFRELKFDKVGDLLLYCQLHGAPDGTGMAMRVHVKPASEVAAVPTTDKSALTSVPPTPAPAVAPPPNQPLQQQVKTQLVGVLSYGDHTSFSDTVNVQLTNLEKPPSGKVYYGWLIGSDNRFLNIGKIEADEKGVTNVRQSFARRNLIADFDSFVITAENPNGTPKQPGEVYYSAKEPPTAFASIREIVGKAPGTPNLYGYAVGARIQVDEVVRQAAFTQELMKTKNLTEVKAHAEAIINLSKGGAGEDLDGDKQIVQPGDGYGLRKYIEGAVKAAGEAKAAKDATGAIKLHSDHVAISGQNSLDFLADLEKQAQAVLAAKQPDDAKDAAAAIETIAVNLRDGVDKDNNGSVDPMPGEGAIFSMYDHAQYIAAMAVVSGKGGQIAPVGVGTEEATPPGTQEATPEGNEQATPAGTEEITPGGTEEATPAGTEEVTPAGTEEVAPGAATPEATSETVTEEATQTVQSGTVTIKMLDFEFDQPKVTVKVGSEVTWLGAGAGPRHSATADDNSFDTDLYGPGKSKTIKFDKPGTFPYYCALHGAPNGEGMSGVITVVP